MLPVINKERILTVLATSDCPPTSENKKYVIVKKSSDSIFSLSYKGKRKKLDFTAMGSNLGTPEKAGRELGNIVLRSPQGMLYFLGKISRAYRKDTFDPKEGPEGVPRLIGGRAPLFVVRKGVATGDMVITVTYDGETYGIPAGIKERGFSMLAINLVSQIIALQKDPKNIPQPNLINIFSN